MPTENMSFNSVTKTCLMARLCLCVSVLALAGCGTTNTNRYGFWRSSNEGNDAPDLRNMPNNSNGDNQARNKLNGLQQQLMADHAAAITALQNQGAPTVSVLSSAQDIVPVTQNKVTQQALMPPPLPVKLPQPTLAPPQMAMAAKPMQVASSAPKTPTTWSGVSVLPQSLNSVPAPAKTPIQPLAPPMAPVPMMPKMPTTPPVVTFVAPKPMPVANVPPVMPQPIRPTAQTVAVVADQPLPPPPMPAPMNVPPTLPTAPVVMPVPQHRAPAPTTMPVYEPKPLRTYVMPSTAVAQNLPPIAQQPMAVTPMAAPAPTHYAIVAPAPIAQAMADNSSVDINMDALDNFGGPTPLMPAAGQQPRTIAPIRPEVAAAQQPYAYGYSNYSIKREMFESNQGNPIPANDSVLINPLWEAAPSPGDFGNPLNADNNSNPLSSFDTPSTGALLATVPFANTAAKLGPQGLKAVEKLAAQWQRHPKNLSISGFASGLRSATANQQLSNNRGNAVKQRLVALGVPARQIRLVANANGQNKTPRVDVFVDSE